MRVIDFRVSLLYTVKCSIRNTQNFYTPKRQKRDKKFFRKSYCEYNKGCSYVPNPKNLERKEVKKNEDTSTVRLFGLRAWVLHGDLCRDTLVCLSRCHFTLVAQDCSLLPSGWHSAGLTNGSC